MIWEISGELGVDPYPLTLRKLVWMLDARRLAEWDRAAMIAAMIFNKDQRKQLPPRRFNPYRNTAEKRQKLTARQMGQFFQEAIL
jgi:hypothetical protein